MTSKPIIVISAVNLNKGGTLAILRECLEYLSTITEHYRVIALVHRKALALYDGIEYIELPDAKKSWLHRLYCEHFTMRRISKHLPPIRLWLSLHDTTPSVVAERRAVYCHNSFPFYQRKLRDLWMNYKVYLFSWLTNRAIYRPNIHHNQFVILQTEWLREAFHTLYQIDYKKLIVFPPYQGKQNDEAPTAIPDKSPLTTFFYPATADVHKNFEVLCQATAQLEEQIGTQQFQTIITIRGDENRYARYLFKKWSHINSLRFIGYQDKAAMLHWYATADALIFPSKVETWGLPITEFAPYHKPILLADLPYAHETAGGIAETAYFSPNSSTHLSALMYSLVRGDTSSFTPTPPIIHREPLVRHWAELFDQLLQ